MLGGFVRCQEASYIALELPHGWWLWGLDTEVGEIDERQKKFFLSLFGEAPDPALPQTPPEGPRRLIVATCAPTTVFGMSADRDDEKSARAFFQLKLPRPFLEADKLERNEAGEIIEPLLGADQCRLDISGDVHQYARYWGPAPPDTAPPPREKGEARPVAVPNYASVVSGLGGAFLHPTQTYLDEVREHVLYPSEQVSRGAIAREVFRFWKISQGGGVWLAGLLIAFVIYCALTISQSSHEFVHSFDFWEDLELERQVRVNPTVPTADSRTRVEQFWTGDDWPVPPPPTTPPICAAKRADGPACLGDCEPPRYFLGACAVASTPAEYKVGVGLMLASLALVIVGFALGERLLEDPDEAVLRRRKGKPSLSKAEAKTAAHSDTKDELPKRSWFEERPFLKTALLALPTMLCAVLALLTLRPYRAHITPFGNSMLVLLTLIWAVSATVLSVSYSEWLSRKSEIRRIGSGDWVLVWVLAVFAVFSIGAGLWVFGKNNSAAYLVADIVFALVVLAVLIGTTVLGYVKAGSVKKGFLKKAPYGLLGLIHGLLQLSVPYMLVRKGTVTTLVAAAVVVGVFIFVGWWMMRRNLRVPLLVAWLAYGALMLSLPFLTYFGGGLPEFVDYGWLLPWRGWWGFFPALLAGAVGAVMSCVWLGWYFAVSLAFNNHNNEIAGAARVERFKEFIRFRLTRDGLTGYVIAINYPQRDGKHLKPRLVDVFHLRCE